MYIILIKKNQLQVDKIVDLTRSSPRHPYLGDEYASIHSDMGDVLLVQVE